MKDSEEVLSAANVATRILGFVNAPTLQQKVVEKCLNEKTDLSFYDRNREDLYNGLLMTESVWHFTMALKNVDLNVSNHRVHSISL